MEWGIVVLLLLQENRCHRSQIKQQAPELGIRQSGVVSRTRSGRFSLDGTSKHVMIETCRSLVVMFSYALVNSLLRRFSVVRRSASSA